MIQDIDVLVIGAGQAGIAMSEHLGRLGVPHIVIERGRIAERWRSERWDSLVANGPAWHDRFPGLEFDGLAPDAFAPKELVADYFVKYAEMLGAPVLCGVEVTRVRPSQGALGFEVETSEGRFHAQRVVVATGAFQAPAIPPIAPEIGEIRQIHSSEYHNPDQLPPGAVLVVGAGSSGAQIAVELNKSGRRVFLAVGPHDRPPRRYRGRDNVWWLGVLGLWEAAAPASGAEHVTIAVSGANGGHTVDFRELANEGITLVGRAVSSDGRTMRFADDLSVNIERGDSNYLSVLDQADEYVLRNGLDLPEEPQARVIGPDPECMENPILELDLEENGFGSIIWATGFSQDYSWLEADTFDENGRPIHERGVSKAEGVYFLGLPWQSRRGSSFIWGVWHDAKFIADQIVIQRTYHEYRGSAAVVSDLEIPTESR